MRTIRIALLAFIGSCITDPANDRVCPQTYEFGNYGCAVVRGQALDTSNQPMSGVMIGLGSSAGSEGFNTAGATTGIDGRFVIRLVRFAPSSSTSGSDSASVWIRGVSSPITIGSGSSKRDSVLVRVRVAPVGATPDTVAITLRPKGPIVAHPATS
jgi:hypothetical protein